MRPFPTPARTNKENSPGDMGMQVPHVLGQLLRASGDSLQTASSPVHWAPSLHPGRTGANAGGWGMLLLYMEGIFSLSKVRIIFYDIHDQRLLTYP